MLFATAACLYCPLFRGNQTDIFLTRSFLSVRIRIFLSWQPPHRRGHRLSKRKMRQTTPSAQTNTCRMHQWKQLPRGVRCPNVQSTEGWRIEQVTLIDLLLPHLYRNPSQPTWPTCRDALGLTFEVCIMRLRYRDKYENLLSIFDLEIWWWGGQITHWIRVGGVLNNIWRYSGARQGCYKILYIVYTVSWCLVIFSLCCHVVALHHRRTKLGSMEFPWAGLHGKSYWAPVC